MKLRQHTPANVTTAGENLLAGLTLEQRLSMRTLFLRPVGADIYLIGAQGDAAADSAVTVMDGGSMEVENIGPHTVLWAKTVSGSASVKLSANCDTSGR